MVVDPPRVIAIGESSPAVPRDPSATTAYVATASSVALQVKLASIFYEYSVGGKRYHG